MAEDCPYHRWSFLFVRIFPFSLQRDVVLYDASRGSNGLSDSASLQFEPGFSAPKAT
ncbi:protein of unknown function [Nitrospira defluvii]|uniref:Uncharacterized protein n=1 Tax=Nitrospira defluvii TaxID=330214 RepID=D8PBJ9_9BACT|nr:protein of unknown function [Nitrospira defluvii]